MLKCYELRPLLPTRLSRKRCRCGAERRVHVPLKALELMLGCAHCLPLCLACVIDHRVTAPGQAIKSGKDSQTQLWTAQRTHSWRSVQLSGRSHYHACGRMCHDPWVPAQGSGSCDAPEHKVAGSAQLTLWCTWFLRPQCGWASAGFSGVLAPWCAEITRQQRGVLLLAVSQSLSESPLLKTAYSACHCPQSQIVTSSHKVT